VDSNQVRVILNPDSIAMPTLQAVAERLTRSSKALLTAEIRRNYYTVPDTIYRKLGLIPLQEWADAIGQTILENLPREVEFTSSPLNEGAYLAMGTQLYRLSPVALLAKNKALQVARRIAKEKADTEIKAYREQAQSAIDGLLADAKQKRQAAEEYLRGVQSNPPVPRWIRDNRIWVHYRNGVMFLEIKLTVVIVGFDTVFSYQGDNYDYHWDAVEQFPVDLTLTVPVDLDGSYSITRIRAVSESSIHPHISTSGSCLEVGDAPPLLNNIESYNRLCQSLVRVLRRVQLNSLFCSPDEWMSIYGKAFPEDLRGATMESRTANLARDLWLEANQPLLTSEDEDEELWTTE
jgi:hypothetical protein